MKKHIKFRDYNYSVTKLDQLSKEQLSDVDGGVSVDKPFIKIIVSPPGYVAPAIFE